MEVQCFRVFQSVSQCLRMGFLKSITAQGGELRGDEENAQLYSDVVRFTQMWPEAGVPLEDAPALTGEPEVVVVVIFFIFSILRFRGR